MSENYHGKIKTLLLTESGFDNRKQIILKQKECRTLNCQMKLKINQEVSYSSCILLLPLILRSKLWHYMRLWAV